MGIVIGLVLLAAFTGLVAAATAIENRPRAQGSSGGDAGGWAVVGDGDAGAGDGGGGGDGGD